MNRAVDPNPDRTAWEVIVIEPPLLGQYETTVSQAGTWRIDDSTLVPRQEQFAHAIGRILGYGSHLGRTVGTKRELEQLIKDAEAGDPIYFLPHMTICGPEAEQLPLARNNFYGGRVRHRHQGTKVMTRPLVGPHAVRPDGWSEEFAKAVAPLAIPGYAVFDQSDFREAAERVLDLCGRARVKLATGADGEGQFILSSAQEITPLIQQVEAQCPLFHGASVEADIAEPKLYGVNTEWVGQLQISFVGEYIRNHSVHGREIGLGSREEIVLGPPGMLDLAPTQLAHHANLPYVLEIAATFDAALGSQLPDVLVTRRQHQFIAGADARGVLRVGTLEQSWRRGAISANTLLAAEVCIAKGVRQVSAQKANYHQGPLTPGMWKLYERSDGSAFVSEITAIHP